MSYPSMSLSLRRSLCRCSKRQSIHRLYLQGAPLHRERIAPHAKRWHTSRRPATDINYTCSKPISKWGFGLFVGVGACFVTYLGCRRADPILLDSPGRGQLDHSQESDVGHFRPVYGPVSLEGAEAILRNQELSTKVGRSIRFDHVTIPSNDPSEDMAALLLPPDQEADPEDDEAASSVSPLDSLVIVGIFDGHAGCATSTALGNYLIHYVLEEFEAGFNSDQMDKGIKRAFLKLDHDILEFGTRAIEEPRYLPDAVAETAAAFSGSCALLSIFNEKNNELKVACTGDSRAVLGRQDATGKWTAIPLSVDQTGYNQAEVTRLQAGHPKEDEMLRDGRLLGLAVTRAFGDARWKWPREIQEKAAQRLFGHKIREPLISPPYLTAEPEITTTKIMPEKGDFVIMASDGLWDSLSNEQAVQLVARWAKLNNLKQAARGSYLDVPEVTEWAPYSLSQRRKPKSNADFSNGLELTEKDFVYKDANAATHLARHALGGGNIEWLLASLTGKAPYARSLRDDITVSVLFFGQEGDGNEMDEGFL